MRKLTIAIALAVLSVGAQGAFAAYGDHAVLQPRPWDAAKQQRQSGSASAGATAPAPAFDNRAPEHNYMPEGAVRRQPAGGGDPATAQFFRFIDSGIPK